MKNFLKRQLSEFRFWFTYQTNFVYEPFLSEGFLAAHEGDFEKAHRCIVALEKIFGNNDPEILKLKILLRKFEIRENNI